MWKTSLIPPLLEPSVYLLVIGVGIGGYVKEMDGVPYLTFVAAGVMATESIMRAAFECTWGTFYRMKIQNTFEAMISTPVSAYDVAFGEILWGAAKAFVNAFVLCMILLFLHVLKFYQLPFVFFMIFLGSVNFSSFSAAYASKIPDFEYFNFYYAILFPLTFVCGTYFPLHRLPDALQYSVWVFPLTSVVDVIRTHILQRPDAFFYAKFGFIFCSTVLFVEISLRSFRARLIQ